METLMAIILGSCLPLGIGCYPCVDLTDIAGTTYVTPLTKCCCPPVPVKEEVKGK